MKDEVFFLFLLIGFVSCQFTGPKNRRGSHLDTETALKNQKTNITYAPTTNNRMNLTTFWRIIDTAHQQSGDDEQLKELLFVTELTTYSPEEIMSLKFSYNKFLDKQMIIE